MINIAPMLASLTLDHRKFSAATKIMSKEIIALNKGFTRLGKQGLTNFGRNVGAVKRQIFSLKSAFAALGLGMLAKSFVDTGSKMDLMRVSLDTLTKGKGEEWFKKLNEWAMKMPVNTEKAIEAFKNMQAMGLKPSIDQMTTLVDATMAMGGGADVMMGLARAIGQISSKGRVMQQELYQLAERGVPAMTILADKLGYTNEQMAEVGKLGIPAAKAIQALFDGMKENFGGLSQEMMKRWSGLVDTMRSYWVEFKRLVMEAGVLKYLEAGLGLITDKIAELREKGKLDEWAKKTADSAIDMFETIALGTAGFIDSVSGLLGSMYDRLRDIWAAFTKLPRWVQEIGILGAFVGGKKWSFVLMGLLLGLDKLYFALKKHALLQEGYITESEYMSMTTEQVKEKLEELTREGLEPANKSLSLLDALPKSGGGLEKKIKESIVKIRKEVEKLGKSTEKIYYDIPFYIKTQKKKAKTFGQIVKDIYGKSIEEQQKALEKMVGQDEKALRIQKETAEEIAVEKGEAQLRANETFVDGVKRGLEELTKDTMTWGDTGYEIIKNFASASQDAMSDLFFDIFRGELKSFEDYWKSIWNSMLRTFADILARMVTEWLMAQAAMKLFGINISGGGVGGGGGTASGIVQSAAQSAAGKWIAGKLAGGGAAAGGGAYATTGAAASMAGVQTTGVAAGGAGILETVGAGTAATGAGTAGAGAAGAGAGTAGAASTGVTALGVAAAFALPVAAAIIVPSLMGFGEAPDTGYYASGFVSFQQGLGYRFNDVKQEYVKTVGLPKENTEWWYAQVEPLAEAYRNLAKRATEKIGVTSFPAGFDPTGTGEHLYEPPSFGSSWIHHMDPTITLERAWSAYRKNVEYVEKLPNMKTSIDQWKWQKQYAPGYFFGASFVPETVRAVVHKGERIFSAWDNKDLISAVKNINNKGQEIHFHLHGVVTTPFVDEWVSDRMEAVKQRTIGTQYVNEELWSVGIDL